eukprot:384667-Pelagomonas_calceolata.AAC.1
MQAAPAIHCLLAPLKQSAADHKPGAIPSKHQGRGPGPHRTANFRAFTSLFTQQLTPSSKHKFNIPSQLELCKSVGLAASWNGPQVDCEVPGTGHPQAPGTAGASTKVC